MNMNNDQKSEIKKQVDIAIMRYGFNMPKSVARAKAMDIVNKEMKNYDGKTPISTFLSKRLMKLSRSSYKRSSISRVPERKSILKKKVKEYSEEYKDTFGKEPGIDEVSRKFGITKKEASFVNDMLSARVFGDGEESSVKASYTDGISSNTNTNVFEHSKSFTRDVLRGSKTPSQIQRKHDVGKTSFFKYKNSILNKVRMSTDSRFIDYE